MSILVKKIALFVSSSNSDISANEYRFFIVMAFKPRKSTHNRSFPFALGMNRTGTAAGFLYGTILPEASSKSKYFLSPTWYGEETA